MLWDVGRERVGGGGIGGGWFDFLDYVLRMVEGIIRSFVETDGKEWRELSR